MSVYKETLLEETKDFMKRNGIKPEDVDYCKTKRRVFSWSVFEKCANFEYDKGYGTQEVLGSLEIHGCTGYRWTMYRWEYDGSEWWEIVTDDIGNLEQVDEIKLLYDDLEIEEKYDERWNLKE